MVFLPIGRTDLSENLIDLPFLVTNNISSFPLVNLLHTDSSPFSSLIAKIPLRLIFSNSDSALFFNRSHFGS